MKAIYNDQIIAESDETVIIEGNHYFPTDSVKKDFLIESNTFTICPWKGIASYYHLVVNGEKVNNAAWYYRNPRPLAEDIKGYIAFWPGFIVT